MPRWFSVILLCGAASVPALCQTSTNKYQSATIMAVAAHPKGEGQADSDVARYDVSVRVGDTVYVVLYTPPNGANRVEYAAGMDLLVLVGTDSITFSKAGTTAQVPILSRAALPAGTGPDWTKAPGQYFSLKLQNLTEKLDLSDDQQAKIKPILEQETGELRNLWGNSTLSQKEKLNQLEKTVRSSDKKIIPLLSQSQVEKLQEMRKEQREELKKRLDEPERRQ